jgi:predicted MFS family arabinose efflux permease
MPSSRHVTFRLLGVLYVSQYLGVGFIYFGLTPILREQGVGLGSIGLIHAIGALWAVKLLWAPLVDRFGGLAAGHYRAWVLYLQPFVALTIASLLLVTDPVEQVRHIVVIIAVYVAASATQDLAVDALAVRLVPPRDRGHANGLATAGAWGGNILGGGLVVVVHGAYGWTAAVLVLTVLTLVPLLVVVPFREPRWAAPPAPLRQGYGAFLTVFRQPGCRSWAFVVVPLFFVGTSSVYGLISTALVDAGWGLTRIGVTMGVVIGVPAVVAATLTGAVVARLGHRVTVLGSGTGCVLATIALMPLMHGFAPAALTTLAISAYVAMMSAATTVTFTVNMSYSRAETAATDFTALASYATACTFAVGGLLMALAGRFGYPSVVWVSVVLTALGTAAAAWHLARHDIDGLRDALPGDSSDHASHEPSALAAN